MNQHLQQILSFVQQDNSLSADQKSEIITSLKGADKELEITTIELDRTEKAKKATAILLEETIEELEEKRKAVAVQKRELEIESSLERVRTVAMSMNKPEDMLDICRVISAQLELLNVKEIRNVQTAIFYKEKGTYMNYEYYTKHDKKNLTETSYTNSEIHSAFAAQMMKGAGESFATHINGDEVKKWIAHQKTTNVFIDDNLYTASSLNYYWHSLGPVALGISTYEPLKEEDERLFRRLVKVFELAYRRYLDIENAEAQTREAKIEAALERVRSRSLAVHHTDEFKEVITVVFEKLQELGIVASSVSINILNKFSKDAEAYICGQNGGELSVSHIRLVYFDHPISNDRYNAQKNGVDFFSKTYSYEEKNSFFEYLFKVSDLKYQPDDIKKMVFQSKRYTISMALTKNSMIIINDFEGNTLSEKESDIVKRFAKVFEQAYIRFLDLQKAEAQAREARIEAALEKIRSRSLGMHHSVEIKDVVSVLFEKLKELELVFDGGAAIHLFPEGSKNAVIWVASPDLSEPSGVNLPFDENAFKNNPIITDVWKAKETGEHIYNKFYSFEEKNVYFNYVFKHNDFIKIPKASREFILQADSYTASFIATENSLLGANSWTRQLFSDNDFVVLKRIASVFEQAYIRFLDLQKAEAQAREAQIQLALERVRARTMAMQTSEELADVATVLFKQVNDLGIKMWTTGFNIWSDDNNAYEDWITNPEGGFIEPYVIDAREFSQFKALSDARKTGTDFFILYQEGEILRETYEQLSRFANKNQFGKILQEGFQFPLRQFVHMVFGSKVSLMFITYDPVPEAHDIFKRFGKVFEQTYTRFLDLQKAEAQAREAKIEAALERVRSSAMAMHSSEGLFTVTRVLREQMALLEQKELESIIIHIYNEEDDTFEAWYSYRNPDDPNGKIIDGKNIVSWSHTARAASDKEKYLSKEIDYTIVADRNMLTEWYNHLKGVAPEVVELDNEGNILVPDVLYYNYSKFPQGALLLITNSEASANSKRLLKRSAEVFNLAYTRFLDLQKAEAQAREASIEAALERVRSRTLAMQKSDELSETAAVLFKQLILLGIEPNRLYVNIIKGENGAAEFWITGEDGSKVSSAFESNLNNNPSFKKMYEGWKEKKKSLMIDMKGRELEAYFQYLGSLHIPLKDGPVQKRRLQYIAYFNKGFIGMASPDVQPEETVLLLERFAAVFNLTFTRFNDLTVAEAHAIQAGEDLIKLQTEKRRAEDALAELKETQKQLIQSEKMASLGELTAGIAHEIQNPLNFVNNFSEVSKELLDEMKIALTNGDNNNAKDLANDVIQNLEKINHHGKRADAIVKGMLQHSRSSNKIKEPTDINALIDEYIRLCYHGLRAKDNSFNATIKMDFDNTIEKINIIPQEIGRVLLNVLTNAFYAVNEKKKAAGESYKPVVSVQTKNTNKFVEIIVKDNGNGISSKVLDKIFQPFFTTKPTGYGTGLGLSLSYDIIKAHGGEINVETKEGEGSGFIIKLPMPGQ